ncbi:hypothetical protein ACIBHY_53915 [Nonomuraea sp. NPDC050547]|uniref:hypothetical protein n=1 Tax=Nonomuraea sp. NPDC050547 TaxID=3364368 RepID=UPI0037AF3376
MGGEVWEQLAMGEDPAVDAAQRWHQHELGLGLVAAAGRVAPAVPSETWQVLVEHAPTRQRYRAKVCRRGDDACWPWWGAISDSGHGKLRAGSKPEGTSRVVTAHVYGWQLHHGLIAARAGEDLVVAHACDEAACQNPRHWRLVERYINNAEYTARRARAEGPLADVRGAGGRARAVAHAIGAARRAGSDVEAAILAAQAAGVGGAPRLM